MRGWREVLAIGLLGATLAVQAGPDSQRLRVLVEQGRMGAAYAWAQEHRSELAGLPGFDFYYGVAAIDTGHVAEGVFALERVLMRRPELDRARLELARGYFLLGEDPRARQEFRTVLAHDPPEAVVATVERFLEAIRRRAGRYETVLTAYIELLGGYDNNINSATNTETVALPDWGVTLTLADANVAQDDAFWQVAAGAAIRKPLSPHIGLFAGVDMNRRGHARQAEFDTGRVAGRAGWEWRGDSARVRLSGRIHRFFLGGSPFQDRLGLGADLRYSLSDTTAATGFFQVGRLTYTDQPLRDARLWSGGVGVNHVAIGPFRPAVSLRLFGGQEVADEDSQAARALAEQDFYGAQAGLRFILHPEISLRLGARGRRSTYGAAHWLFDERRRETYWQAEAGLHWQFPRQWRLGPTIHYSQNAANIPLYEYERAQVGLRLRYDHF